MLKYMIFGKKSLDYFPSESEKEYKTRLLNLRTKCKEIIQVRKNELLKVNSQFRYNFLDQYLKEIIQNDNKEIKVDEIVDNFLSLFFAGTDTTGNMTGSALYYLSLNPDI